MNAYSVLGVVYDASPEEIKRAYKILAQIHHPDKGGDVNIFKQVKAAYDWLIANPYVEEVYDDHVKPQVNPNATYYEQPFRSAFDNIDEQYRDEEVVINKKFSPLNNELGFAGFMGANEVVYNIPLELAYAGGVLKIHVPNYETEEIRIMPLTNDGHKHTLTLYGTSAWMKGRRQNVQVILRIAPHKFYTVSNGDLICKFILTLPQLLERLPLKLPHPNGKESLPIVLPFSYNLGEVITLREKGFKVSRYGVESRGDIIISIVANIPDLSQNQIRRIRAIMNESV